MPPFTAALELRDRVAFTALLRLVFADLPIKALPRTEATYHSALFCSLRWSAPPGVVVRLEAAQRSGASEIVIQFAGPNGAVEAVWIVEVAGAPANTKPLQSLRYVENFGEEVAVLRCAMSVAKPVSASVSARQGDGNAKPALSVVWERRTKAGPAPAWETLA